MFEMESESGICPDLSGHLQLELLVIFVKGFCCLFSLTLKAKTPKGLSTKHIYCNVLKQEFVQT